MDGVEVSFSDGRIERGDLLVGADGIHSHVRRLIFGDGFERPLGGHYIAVTQTLRHGLPPLVHSYLGTGRMVNLFPVAPDSVSAVVYVGASVDPPRHGGPFSMRNSLLATCAGFPEEVLTVVGDIKNSDFIFSDAIAQVDAAHSRTSLSGMGSSLALQDAHILAGCLARSPDNLPASLEHYEAVTAPIARRYKNSALRAHRALLHSSPFRAGLRDVMLRLVPERLFDRGVRQFFDAERPISQL